MNIEYLTSNLKREYDYFKTEVLQNFSVLSKWYKILKSKGITNDFLIQEISIFLETYSKLEVSKKANITMQNINMPAALPQDVISTNECLALIIDDFNDFNLGTELKYNIVSEYYNMFNGKKGLLLEGGRRLEDGKFVNPKHQNEVIEKLKKVLYLRIDWILDPSKRKIIDRNKKLKKINNNV